MIALGRRIRQGAVWLLLGLALVVPTIAGLLTPYIIVAIGIGILLVLTVRRHVIDSYRPLASRLFLAAFVLLALAFTVSAQAPRDVLFAFNFVMLLLAAPIAHLLAGAANHASMTRASVLAAVGVMLTFAMVLYFSLMGDKRPEGLNLGPIVLSNAALALAAVATMGTIALKSRWSLFLPLTLVLAVATTVLTQSRGPLIAVVPLLLFTGGFLWFTRFRGSWLLGGAVAALVALIAAAAYLLEHGRISRLPGILAGLFSGETIVDHTTAVRLALYEAGWKAFLDSPWIGHGWARLMSSVLPYMSSEMADYARRLPQLHNDVLNFAVSGGVVGVAAYVLIIATPCIAAVRSPHDRWRTARIYGSGALATVYVGGGLTDLMFGHEYHTALYVMLSVIILFYCRDASETPPSIAT
ncbi:MAG: O-antigen ligase family protein [Devosia nanyangense]|uniref:O-antigen ligase family protein n=1 Tax=Devosia nanyangense TaxID=1228055 RepID=A0A933L0F9_9HYPH|nr:O-antigen ligase family protein [Devosia nanyangense]